MQQHGIWRGLFWLALMALAGCGRSGVKEAPITGRAGDPPTGMPVHWEAGKRYIYRVEVSTSSMVPRRTTGVPIHVETTLGQDLAFSVTNAPNSGSGRILTMELLAVQMETARDDGTTVFFDSDNKAYLLEDNPLAERLQKLVGLRMKFQLSPENKVTRVDGLKDLNDRMTGSSIRGVANGVVSRFFNQQFFRDIIEMGMMPQQPVTVGHSWSTSRQVNAGLWGSSAQLDVRYTFKGWQRRQGTNCARLEFAGKFSPAQTLQAGPPGGTPPTNGPGPAAGAPGGPSTKPLPNSSGTNASATNAAGRRVVTRNAPSNMEEGTLSGRAWYDPDLALAVETIYDQAITTRSSSNTRRVRGTNVVVTVDPSNSNAPPVTNITVSASPPATPTSTTSKWHTRIRLLEIEPLRN